MIVIENRENISQFRANSKLCKQIEEVCRRFGMKPKIQVFRASKDSPYRGVTLLDTITLYWSEIETTKSIFWVFCHELRHVMFNLNHKLYEAIEEKELAITEAIFKKKIRKMSADGVHKTVYRVGITEVLCDLFATEIIGKDYGDKWFSKRIKERKDVKSNRR